MRSQEDLLDEVITEAVLNQQVSKVLCLATERLMSQEIIEYGQACECLLPLNISFWLSSKSDF